MPFSQRTVRQQNSKSPVASARRPKRRRFCVFTLWKIAAPKGTLVEGACNGLNNTRAPRSRTDASQPGKLTLYTSMKLPRVPNKVSAALQSMSGSCRPVPSRCKLRTVFHPSDTAERHGDLFAVAPLTKIVLAGMKTPLTRPRVRRCRHGEGTRHRMRT